MEYPDYKYRPKKRQKSEGQAGNTSPGHNIGMVKQETEEEFDTPVKRRLIQSSEFKEEPRQLSTCSPSTSSTLLMEAPESPSYTFPNQNLSPDYFQPQLTPPSKVPSSPEMVSRISVSKLKCCSTTRVYVIEFTMINLNN